MCIAILSRFFRDFQNINILPRAYNIGVYMTMYIGVYVYVYVYVYEKRVSCFLISTCDPTIELGTSSSSQIKTLNGRSLADGPSPCVVCTLAAYSPHTSEMSYYMAMC
jgi:hypothetical protein